MAGLMAVSRGSSERWLSKRRAHLARSLAMKLLRQRLLDVEVFGAKMRLRPAHNQSEKRLAFTPQFFDAAERAVLAGLFHTDFVFVDIGADVGGYTLFVAAHAGPRARILAIEPQPEVFERLVFNIRQNAFSTVKALACAVADADGPVTLFINPLDSGQTSMRVVNAHAKGRQVVVQARSLAALAAEEGLTRIDAMKVDIEGAEDLVLEPFFRDAPQSLWPDVLIVERVPGQHGLDLDSLLRGCGYSLEARMRLNLVYRRG